MQAAKLPATRVIVRVKTKGIEIDLRTEDIAEVVKSLKEKFVVKSWRLVQETPPIKDPSRADARKALALAESLCDDERFWEAHVALESVWLNSTGDLRDFLQGLIQVISSQVQVQMEKAKTAQTQYERAVNRLRNNVIYRASPMHLPDRFEYPLNLKIAFLI